jgi:hypothetical protein
MERTSQQNGVAEATPSKIVQYFCLYCIYYATNGHVDTVEIEDTYSRQDSSDAMSWKNTSGWESTNADPCSFFGIMCDAAQQIQTIRLQRNGLMNVFPFGEAVFLSAIGEYHLDGVGNLRRLEIFENENLTSDSNFDAFMQSLIGLESMLYQQTFVGKSEPIPRLPNTLQQFDCSYAGHKGLIPEESFAGLNVLLLVSLDGNDVTNIPTSLASLPNLQFLYARDTSLNGDLAYMERMTSIVEHAVDNNPGLSGPLFPFIGRLEELRSFSAADCSLTGSLPAGLAKSGGNLVQLWLHGNNLHGTIPMEYSTIEDLRILTLEDNQLSGRVPIEICLNRFDGKLESLSVDCDAPVQCSEFFPECCTCCGRSSCGS